MEKAANLLGDWVKKQNIQKAVVEVVKLPNRVPLLFIDIPANTTQTNKTVIFYGHLDKMPEAGEWSRWFWTMATGNKR